MHPLDRLDMLLAAKSRSEVPSALHLEAASTVGGIVEFLALRWAWHARTGEDLLNRLPQRELPPLFRFVSGHSVVASVFGFRPHGGSSSPSAAAEIRTIPPPGPAWQSGSEFALFLERFKDSLRPRGYSADSAFLLAGALKEMASNAVEHAMASVVPLAAYRVGAEDWEFSVTDVGRGVLASMRSNPEFAHIPTAVEALRTALKDGVSSTGQPGRGCGFSTLFKALVDRDCTLRLRSAGASAWWRGRSATEQTLTMQSLADRVGFHIAVAGRTQAATNRRAP